MELTPHQKEKHDEVIAYFKAGQKRVILQGDAGTGKTTTSDKIIETIKKDRTINPNYNNGHIYACAPTNKALAVLTSKITAPIDFKTLHSALKLRKFTDRKSGIECFIRNKQYGRLRGDEFDQCKFAVIDESSMVGKGIEGSAPHKEPKPEDVVKGLLQDYTFPILYMGDEKQLSPVKEKYSPVFHKGYPVVELTEIVRQGAGNPIRELSKDLDLIYFKQPNVINGKGYVYDNDRMGIIESLAEVNGTNELKYLALANTDIDAMNKAVRTRIYNTPNKIEKGEMLVFNEPYGTYYTNEEAKVMQIDVVTDYIYIPNAKSKYDANEEIENGQVDKIKMKFYSIMSHKGEFRVVHEHSTAMYHSIYASVLENCNYKGWDFRGKSYTKKIFANITYNHAITVHKSQGSTYNQVILNIGNMMFCPEAEERQRLLYTAVTRASDLVILNNVK